VSLDAVYMLRHGETEMNRQLRCQGRIDIPLNGEGRRQAAVAAEKFREIQLDAIYSSPLSRAVQSAEAIAAERGLEVVILEWLQEIDHGALEGLDRREADEKYPGVLDDWLERPHEVDFPGGEKLEQVAERVRIGMLELVTGSDGGTVLLVTHQIISGVAKCLLDGLPLSRVWEDKLVNGDYFIFEITPGKISRLEKWKLHI